MPGLLSKSTLLVIIFYARFIDVRDIAAQPIIVQILMSTQDEDKVQMR